MQIDGHDGDFLLDEEQNIYDFNLNQIGKAGASDDEEGGKMGAYGIDDDDDF